MVSIRNNKNSQIVLNVKSKQNSLKQISLIPGVSLGISDELWEQAKKNSTCKKLINAGIIEELKSPPEPKGKLEGFDVYDDSETEEPTPIVKKSNSKKTTRKTTRKKQSE